MLLSHNKQFIFIHNYKVAGSSISDALGKYTEDVRRPNLVERLLIYSGVLPVHYPAKFAWHLTARQLREKLPADIFNCYFKFGFVRNPWDWQVSLYTFMLKTPRHPQHKLIKGMKNFDEYIEWRVNEDFHLQYDAFYDTDGTCLMDFIGKIENIEQDFATVCKRVGIIEHLPHTNKSRPDNSIDLYYTPASVEKVYNAFKQDITTFNYEKPVLNTVMA